MNCEIRYELIFHEKCSQRKKEDFIHGIARARDKADG